MKRIFDIVLAAMSLLFFSPVLLIVAGLIKLDSAGPVFFVQDRLGQNGEVFGMHKFRTMVENAEHIGTGLFSYDDDPRITKIGHFLRKYSLDELPQLWNVLAGKMSIVGPRPPVTYELGDYKDFDDSMKFRFQVKPGITGLAQVSGRNDLDWDKKIMIDNQYVVRFGKEGILLDIKIVFKTVFVVLMSKDIIEKKPES